MENKNFIITAAVIILLSCLSTAMANNISKLSEDVRQMVIQTAQGRRAAGVMDGKLCVFIRFNGDDGERLLRQYGCEKVTQIDDIYIVNVPTDQLGALASCDEVERIETNTHGRLMMDVTPKWVDNSMVNSGLGLPQAYDGSGVLMGIVDCGFDLTHPTLYSTDGNSYRVQGVVDDYTVDGETLGKETALGREYLNKDEILAKKYTNDINNNHGTHCIGIAAGSGYGTPYRGIAYGADIFAISSKNASDDYLANSADQAARMKRIFDFADEKKMPCVITYSIGFSPLPNDSQLFAEWLDKLVGSGHILVAAAGNDNMQYRYIRKDSSADAGTTLDMRKNSTVGAYLTADKPFKIKCFSAESVNEGMVLTDSIVFDTEALPIDTVVTKNLHIIMEKRESYHLLTARNDNGKPTLMPFVLTGEDATVELRTVSSYALVNIPESRFNGATANHNVNLPGSLESAITVGALNGRQSFTNYADSVIYGFGNRSKEGTIAAFSSCGPTADNRIKPDVVTPGVNIISSGNRYCKDSYGTNVVKMTTFNEQEYPWIALSGTSMATPCAAGVVALWLQADPTLTPQRIKDIIKKTSKKIEVDGQWPNNTYGYGLIDAYAGIIEVIKGTTGIQHISSHQPTALTIRPAEGRQICLTFNQAPQKAISVTVYSISGTMLYQQTLTPTGATTYTIQLPHAQSGAHIIQVNSPETGLSGSEIIRWN